MCILKLRVCKKQLCDKTVKVLSDAYPSPLSSLHLLAASAHPALGYHGWEEPHKAEGHTESLEDPSLGTAGENPS